MTDKDHSFFPDPERRRGSNRWIVLAVVAWMFGSTLASIPAAAGETHRLVTWAAPGADQPEASALSMVFDKTRACFRLLIEPPDDAPRVVLTLVVDPFEGTDETTLLDDESGWWMSVVVQYPIQTTDAFTMNYLLIETPSDALGSLIIRVDWAGGEEVEMTLPRLRQPEPQYLAVAEVLEADGHAEALLASLPEGLAQSIDFIDEVATLGSEVGYPLRAVVEVIQNLEGDPTPERQGWIAHPERIRRGLEFDPATETEAAALLSRFERVPADEPLPPICHRTD